MSSQKAVLKDLKEKRLVENYIIQNNGKRNGGENKRGAQTYRSESTPIDKGVKSNKGNNSKETARRFLSNEKKENRSWREMIMTSVEKERICGGKMKINSSFQNENSGCKNIQSLKIAK